MAVWAEGGNYRIVLERALAWATVWRRPDTDSEAGARFAAAMSADLTRLTTEPRAIVLGAILDLREAPPVAGPNTRKTLGNIASAFERASRRFAFIAGDNPVQRLQLAGVVNEYASTLAQVCEDEAQAEAWVRRGEAPPNARRAPPKR